MTFDDLVILLNKESEDRDKYGNRRFYYTRESLRPAFCNLRDVGREEFYLAQGRDYHPTVVVTMRKREYHGEEYLFFGKYRDMKKNIEGLLEGEAEIYKVIRTYTPGQALLGRYEKNYLGTYKPTTDDVEIVCEVLKGNPHKEIRENLERLWGEMNE